jgi:hypothetical protein
MLKPPPQGLAMLKALSTSIPPDFVNRGVRRGKKDDRVCQEIKARCPLDSVTKS